MAKRNYIKKFAWILIRDGRAGSHRSVPDVMRFNSETTLRAHGWRAASHLAKDTPTNFRVAEKWNASSALPGQAIAQICRKLSDAQTSLRKSFSPALILPQFAH